MSASDTILGIRCFDFVSNIDAQARTCRTILGEILATCMHSADYAVARCLSVCLSVRPSHAGILSKQLYTVSGKKGPTEFWP